MKTKNVLFLLTIFLIVLLTGCSSSSNNNPITGNTVQNTICKDVQVPYETQEAYTEQEPYTVQEPYSTQNCVSRDARYTINKMDKRIATYGDVTYIEICNLENEPMTINYRICKYDDCGQNKVDLETIQAKSCNNPYNGFVVATSDNVKLISIVVSSINDCETITQYRTVTKYRDVTKYMTTTKYKTETQCN